MFCKAEACSELPPAPAPWFVLDAIMVQDVYCISMPGATMRKDDFRIYEICAVRWADLFPDRSRQGAVHLHGHDPTTSWNSMSTPLHPSRLPTCSPFGSGMQSSCQEDGMKPAYDILGAGIFPSWEECSAKLEGRVQERGEKEAYAALSPLQQLLCQMYWSRASQLHLADGTEQPERSCWECGAASTAKMRTVTGSKGPLASQ